MSRRTEYVSMEGLRVDGRRPNEIRDVEIELGLLDRAEGSCFFALGNTKVLAAVYGPHETAWKRSQDGAAIVVTLNAASFSSGERRKGKTMERKEVEMCNTLRRTLESNVSTHLFPNSQIEIYLQVLQEDGGTLAVCLNAASLALMDAGIPMDDFLTACTSGCIDGTSMTDLNQLEENAGGPQMPVAILHTSQKVALLQMDSRIAVDTFEEVFKAGVAGCDKAFVEMDHAIRSHTKQLLESRGIVFNN
eukprot:NODE_3070_length_1056_cov_7.413108_g2818_i0.p1 GENE.NODE_3070_length_1056_cov_7.413108_g2818_i0~~NODE_3070_length_1056_cov_7.413108_g2818_i0.p1  ORF type:complete len:280 (+),score=65.32 NODE_3070_length_1056_cov_7.413108_g2818_i0:97-840(+)